MSRCTGHCCRKFFMPITPDQLADPEHVATLIDGAKIASMVIPLGPRIGGHEYTCKHLDVASGNCMDYDNRPMMCSAYPYGGACHFEVCTLTVPCNVKMVVSKTVTGADVPPGEVDLGSLI